MIVILKRWTTSFHCWQRSGKWALECVVMTVKVVPHRNLQETLKSKKEEQRSDGGGGGCYSEPLGRLCGSWWSRWLAWTWTEAAGPPPQPRRPRPQKARRGTPRHPPPAATAGAAAPVRPPASSRSPHRRTSSLGFGPSASPLKHDSRLQTWGPHLRQDERLSSLASSSK